MTRSSKDGSRSTSSPGAVRSLVSCRGTRAASVRAWEDNDNQGLYWYLEKVYEITGAARVDGALSLHSNRHAFNEVVDYLQGVQWDGVPRLDTLLIDYLGAEDTAYTRAVTRKAFTAAVAQSA